MSGLDFIPGGDGNVGWIVAILYVILVYNFTKGPSSGWVEMGPRPGTSVDLQ